jgi:serine/arginine repetitive matrix protein 2
VHCGRAGQETHELALRKENQMKNLQEAFGLTTAVEGQAFDRELQEQKRLDQIAEREARQKEKELRKKEEEKKREKAAKDQKKAIKAAEKARKVRAAVIC